jgi:NAD(P)H dehydrogenase (quinone)
MRLAMRSSLISLLLLLSLATGARASAATAAQTEKFIISGASGQLGELTIKELLHRGVPAGNLILVSRTPEKLDEFAKLGAVVRLGDVDQPESLAAAYAGGTRMLMISLGFAPGDAPRPPRHKIAFDAAVKAGVKRIVYTSFLGADKGGSFLADDHMQSEKYLMASGARWIALRNSFYADGMLAAALQMATTGQATVIANGRKSTPVTREDCAAAAAGALLAGAAMENRGYDITGPAAFDMRDIARLVRKLTGKPISVTIVAPPAGGPGPVAAPPPVVSHALAALAGRPATSLKALLTAHKAELRAAAASH